MNFNHHRQAASLSMRRWLSVALLLCTVLPGHATQVDTLRHISLDSIVVSSIKQKNSQWALPLSATTVSNTVMQQKQLHGMKEFTATIPNFIMLDRDTRLTSSVFIRGVGSLINTPGVAMYVDGVPHFEKSSFDINLVEIEKIEFLRGPQGTLYGRNAMGGIILVHTPSPFIRQGTKLNLRYGSYDDFQSTISHRGKVNDRVAYAVTADYTYYGGFITNAYNGKKADRLLSPSVNTRLEWRPRTNLAFRLINGFEYTRQGAFTYGDINQKSGRVDSVSTNHESFYKRKLYDGGLQTDYHTDAFWIRAQTSIQLLNDEYNVDQDISPRDLYFVVQKEKQRLLSQEINIRGLAQGNYGWNFGIFAFSHAIDRSTDVFMNMAKPPYKLEKRYDDMSRGLAVFHQSSLRITPRLQLEAGIRYDYERAVSVHKEEKVVEGKAAQLNNYNSPLTFNEWTPKASLQYTFGSYMHLYASIAKGYKTGGFNTVFESEAQRTFSPEKSWNYEAGGKGSFLNRRLNAEIAFFYINIDNQQVKQLLDLEGVKIFNAGKSVSKGFEVSLQAHPQKNLNVSVAYGYTHATFREYVYNEKISYSGNFLPFVPRHTLSVGAEYSKALLSPVSDRITLNVDYRGIGKIYWHENNRVEQPFYGLLNASILVKKQNTSFSVWGKNLTNTHYLGYYLESANRQLGKPGRPFSLGITISQTL